MQLWTSNSYFRLLINVEIHVEKRVNVHNIPHKAERLLSSTWCKYGWISGNWINKKINVLCSPQHGAMLQRILNFFFLQSALNLIPRLLWKKIFKSALISFILTHFEKKMFNVYSKYLILLYSCTMNDYYTIV